MVETTEAAETGEDESRATATTRLTTKERIQQMKQQLKTKREAHKNPANEVPDVDAAGGAPEESKEMVKRVTAST